MKHYLKSIHTQFKSGVLVIATITWMLLPNQTVATPLVTERFDSPVNGLPEEWTAVVSGGTLGVNADASIKPVSIGGNRLEIRRITPNFAAAYFTGSESVPGGTLSDFSSSVIFRQSNSTNYTGIIARSQSLEYYFSGYYIYVYGSSSAESGLYIAKSHGDNVGVPLVDGEENQFVSVNFTGGTDYRLEFTALGSQLTASVYGWDNEEESFTNLLASLTRYDDEFTSGYFGLRNRPGGNGRSTFFNDLTISAIPEPEFGLLIGFLGGLFAILRFTRRYSAAKAYICS